MVKGGVSMITFIKKTLGLQLYSIEITWEDTRDKETVKVKARNVIHALERVSKQRDVADKAVMKVEEIQD